MDRVRLLKPSSHCVLCDVQCLRKVRKSRGGGHKIKKSLLKEELVLLVQAKYGGRAYTCPPSPWTSYSTGPDVRNEKPPPPPILDVWTCSSKAQRALYFAQYVIQNVFHFFRYRDQPACDDLNATKRCSIGYFKTTCFSISIK